MCKIPHIFVLCHAAKWLTLLMKEACIIPVYLYSVLFQYLQRSFSVLSLLISIMVWPHGNFATNCRVGGATVVQGSGVNTCPEPGQPRGKGMTQAIIRFTLTGEHCRWRFFFPPLSICIFAVLYFPIMSCNMYTRLNGNEK